MKQDNKSVLEKQKQVEKNLRENSTLEVEKLFQKLKTSIFRC